MEPGAAPARPEPAAHGPGTSVEVRDLFQALPARRKFLRTERTEFLHIQETVRRLALCRFDVDIRLQHNRRRVLHCRPAERDPDRRLRDILGGAFVREALALDSGRGGMRLWGRVGGANQARNQSDRQYFYLNGRMIRDKRLNHAVRKALEDSIPPGRYPSYVLHLEIAPSATDVNVHPTKQEVRFRHARDVHDFIHAAVGEAMHRAGARQAEPLGAPAGRAQEPAWPLREPAGQYRPAGAAGPDRGPVEPAPAGAAPLVLGRFLLLPEGDGLVLVDCIAAQESLLERKLREGFRNGALRRRPLLVPVLLECSQAELNAAGHGAALLERFGLELEPAGPASLRVRSLPALLEQADIQPLCRDLLAALQLGGADPAQRLTGILARHGAAGATPPDSAAAARALLARLAELPAQAAAGLSRRLDQAQLRQLLDTHDR
jgi:DNA mismatch repair protein MutL